MASNTAAHTESGARQQNGKCLAGKWHWREAKRELHLSCSCSEERETKDQNDEARTALRSLIKRSVTRPTARPSYAFVNNRLEGNSPNTIAAALDLT